MERGGWQMSAAIDNRIVNMIFNNKEFERGVRETTNSLSKLDSSIKLNGASDGLRQMGNDVEDISGRFSNMGIVGMTVLQELTKSAMNAGKKIANSLWEPIFGGGKRRALNIEQAKFQFDGLGMNIDKAMDSANKAVAGTAFGLDEAAKVAAQFGASGMEAGDDMTQALRAISGVAAMTSSSYEDIGRVFTTVSGNGRLMGNQLLQLSGRGLNAAAAIAKSMGVSEGAVREMVTKGQIDFETFYKAMDEAFGEHATAANKTFTGSLSNMKAALSRLGASIYTPALKNLRDIFNALRPVIDGVHEALKPLINKFTEITTVITENFVKALGGINFDPVAKGEKPVSNLARAFNGIKAVAEIAIGAIKIMIKVLVKLAKVISPIFKPIGALIGFVGDLAVAFRDLLKGSEAVDAIFKPLKDVTKTLSDSMGGLRKSTDKVNEGFRPLELLGKAVKKTFEIIGNALSNLGPLITQGMKSALSAIKNIDMDFVSNMFSAGVFTGFLVILRKFFDKLGGFVGRGSGIIDALVAPFGKLSKVLESYQKNLDAGVLIRIAVAIGILTASLAVLAGIDPDKLTGAVTALAIVMGQLMGALAIMAKVMDKNSLKTMISTTAAMTAMVAMSTSVLILSAALRSLAELSWSEIAKGLVGVGGAMVLLAGTSIVLSKQERNMKKATKGMIGFGIALRILVPAIKEMGSMDIKSLVKGLGGLAVVMIELAVFTKIVDNKRLLSTSIAMIALGSAMKKMAEAVGIFGGLGIKALIKGLGAMGVVMMELAIFTKLVDTKGMLRTATAMTILGSAMMKFGAVVEHLGNLSVKQLVKGLGGLAAALTAIAIAMRVMPKGMLMQSIALNAVAAAVRSLSGSLEEMGGMSVESIKKSLVTLAGSLTIFSVALNLMKGTLSGAAAITVAAMGLALLVPQLERMGNMSMTQIGKGLGVLAGSLAILGVAGYGIAPVIPVLASLAGIFAAISVSVLALGVGITALSAGLNMMTINSIASFTALKMFLDGLIFGIPRLIGAIALGLIEFVKIVADHSASIVKSFVQIGVAIIDGLITLTPKVVEMISELMMQLLNAIHERIPDVMSKSKDIIIAFLDGLASMAGDIVRSGLNIITSIVQGLADGIPKLVKTTVDLITAMLDTIADNLPIVIKSAFNLVISFVNGLADAIRDNNGRLIDAGANLIDAILGAIATGITKLPSLTLDLIRTFVKGILDGLPNVRTSAVKLGSTVLGGIKDGIVGIFETGVKAVTSFISGIKSKIFGSKKSGKDGGEAAKKGLEEGSEGTHSLGSDMITGFRNGISSMASGVANAAKGVASGAVSVIKNLLDINSPSGVLTDIGVNTGEGFINGMDSMRGAVSKSSRSMTQGAIEAAEEVLDILDDIDENPEYSPRITPIVDLDDVDESLKSMDAIFGKTTLGSIRNISAVEKPRKESTDEPKDANSEGKVINYTQNIHSPRELNRMDIYRNTRNQLALKGDGAV